LKVSPQEQERRIALPSRSEFAKLTSVETLRRLRAGQSMVERPPSDLAIDTDRTSPTDAADLIITTFGLSPVSRLPRYPD
jgi:hypothetical protein